MTWLLPSAIAIAGIAAVVTLALHFIARTRPLAEPLPTARFIPQRPVQARARAFALSDLLLLVVRMAALAALGIGAAGPIIAKRGVVVRVVLADRSRGVATADELRDSARAYARPGDQLLVFDSVLRAAPTLDSLSVTGVRGSLSAALAAAVRAGVQVAPRADSVELVLISPMLRDEADDATLKIRNAWPGAVRVVRVGPAIAAPPIPRIESTASSADAVVAGLSLVAATGSPGNVRLVRARATPADSSWARGAGHALLIWPETPDAVAWPRRALLDTIGAATSATGTLVATFPRPWTLDGGAIARWADGEPAVVERPFGDGCVRDIGILIDQAGDLTLRQSFRDFAGALLAPCGGARRTEAMSPAMIAQVAGPPGLAPAAALRDRTTQISRATPWLLALGALLLVGELALRRSGRSIA